MPVLDLFNPTKSRSFTYYDRCAILLDPDEMSAQRVRISVTIIGSPVSRSVNLKYPYYREFYGYAQGFWLNALVEEFPINYTNQYIWDYWNQHSTLAHQLSDIFERLRLFLLVSVPIQATLVLSEAPDLAEAMLELFDIMRKLLNCLIIDLEPDTPEFEVGSTFLNSFIHPFDLIRFKFPLGTVFAVAIDSWNLGDTLGGAVPPLYPSDPPYPTENPNANNPFPTPGGNDPDSPYGDDPPDSSPIDPRLDPDDFSNAPDPEPPLGTVFLQGWFIPGIPGQQSEGYAIACPSASAATSIPVVQTAVNPVNLGVVPIEQDEFGRVSAMGVLAAFPGFTFGDDTFGADISCGVTGTF